MTTLNHHALLIGVGADLPNTVQDATGLADLLKDASRCAFDTANVITLTDQAADRVGILAELHQLASRATEDATVVVYFSGHGYIAKSDFGESYWLMPHDYQVNNLRKTAISGKEFVDKLASIKAARLLLLLDCCHAQGIGEAKVPGVRFIKSPLPPEVEGAFKQGKGRIVIASSQAGEMSFTGTPYSLFTRAIIEALSGAHITGEGDGFVRAIDLGMYASRKVAAWSKDRQHPTADFAQADNFVVSYYGAGAKSPRPIKLPHVDEADIESQTSARSVIQGDQINAQGSQGLINRPSGPVTQHFGTQINTGGGTQVAGNVNTGNDFVGRDKKMADE
jgi:hypothetical protein